MPAVTDFPRERYTKRPLVIPPAGGEPVPYERPSTMAKALDDLGNLMAWKQRKTAQGLLMRPDLLTRVAGILANGDPDTDWQTKKELNGVCYEATEAAGASRGSSAGTGFHKLTEAHDLGRPPQFVPEADRARLEAYVKATTPYEPVEVELMVVNDKLRAAGTLDRLMRCPDGRVVVADLKSGKSEAAYPLATTTQISIYSHSLRYDPETGERASLHPDLDPDRGLLIHLPPSGGCRIYELDLSLGIQAAHACADALRMRALTPADLIRETA